MCRQKAGCNPGKANAGGQRAWWQLPRGIWRVLSVLSVWSLANGRLECPNNRGLCAGKGQAALLEQQRLTARGLGGSCREGFGKFSRFLAFEAWANGRLECLNNRGLCAGKGQAAMLEQQRLTARGLGGSLNALIAEGYVQAKGRLQCWNSKGWRPEGLVAAAARDLESFQGFKRLKPGKRQAWMP